MPTTTTLPGLPLFLSTDQSSAKILQAMLALVPPGIDVSEGSFVWDALAPAAFALALAAANTQQALVNDFIETSAGAYIDLRAAEHGVYRLPALAATGVVTFTGTPGTVIADATIVSTGSTTAQPAVIFQTVGAATIPGGGAIDVPIVAVSPGSKGIVAANTIAFLGTSIVGVTGLNNAAVTFGAVDTETDAAFVIRYLAYVANPPAGGNASDYYNWAIVVPGVGAVSVVPLWNGNGTVGAYLLDTNKVPATQTLIDVVQQIIAPPVSINALVNTWIIAGTDAATDATQTDAIAQPSIKFTYDGTSFGKLSGLDVEVSLIQAALWTFRLRSKVSVASGVTPLLRFGIWNRNVGAWCSTTVAARLPTDAGYVAAVTAGLTGTQLTTTFTDHILPFAWNGTDVLDALVFADFVAVANPTVATALAHSAAGTVLGAGVYTLAYTYENGLGETTIGTSTATVTIAAGDKITWTPPALPAGAKSMILYMSIAAGSGTLKRVGSAVNVTPEDFVVLPTAWAQSPPGANTALVGDSTTTLWVDQSRYVSSFSSALGAGKAPIGAQVTVMAPASVAIDVAATLSLVAGADPATVHTACTAAVVAYLKSIAFAPDPTVRWSHVASTISAVLGVSDFSALTVNGGTANVVIPGTSVAVIGTSVWS